MQCKDAEDQAEKEWGDLHDKAREAANLLPAWFTTRMMTDTWLFGLLTDTGITIIINHINDVTQAADGEIWLDVDIETDQPTPDIPFPKFFSPTSRTKASIAVRHIVAAFELEDS